MSTSSRALPAWLLSAACLAAGLSAAEPWASAQGAASASAAAEPPPAPQAPLSGPMPGGSATPKAFLPPGASFPDRGPSPVVYPPQKIPMRFNHKKHMAKDGVALTCDTCHAGALTSTKVQDRLMPAPTVCDGCHGSNHADLGKVQGGEVGYGDCAFCHTGYQPADGNKVQRLEMPTAHLKSNHKVHADRKINCEQCHGAVQDLELATREQLGRMKGCFSCHAMSGPGQGKAKSDCNVCHEPEGDGRMKVAFAEGKLLPPRWMGNLEHTPDFIERHKRVAGDNSQACSSCHTENFCTDCHDGRIRPRNIHPNDYISMHPVEARLDNPRCSSCHQEQQFCMPCHQRSGVSMSGSPGANRNQGRFHPPRAVWSELPRTRQHHAWEAQRNLNACVSCHTERDCVACHGSQSVGGRGFNPHPAGFKAKCDSAARRNPRPCLVCHDVPNPRDLCK